MRKKRDSASAEGTAGGIGDGGDGGTFRLPESGLAEDILRAFLAESGEMSGEKGGETAASSIAGTAGAAERRTAAAPPSSLQGAERVYAFVDRLERHALQETETREDPEIWVTFDLADEVYALPVDRIQEVLRVDAITRVPHAPAPVRGITNMRGRVLAVVDLRVRLGLPPAPVDAQSRILVISSRERSIGLLVDAARQVAKLLPSAVQPPPSDIVTPRSDFLVGVCRSGETLLILLDVDRVLLIHEGTEMPEMSQTPETPQTPENPENLAL